MKQTLAIALVSTACLWTSLTQANEIKTKAVMNHAEMNHAEMNHAEMNHGEMHHGKMNHAEMHHGEMMHGDHAHTPIDVGHWSKTPSLTLTAEKDLVAGWNLHIQAGNFVFTPKNVNLDNQENEGHAHLYINGKKHSRLYSSWFHLDNLAVGMHKITVTLNANDHGPLSLKDKVISASIEIVQE